MSDTPNATPAGPKKSSFLKIIFLILGGLMLGGGGLAAYSFLIHKPAAADSIVKPAAASETTPETPINLQSFSIKPFVVNLRNSKATRYLKITLGFQTNSKKVREDLATMKPELADFIVNKLSDLEVTEIDNLAGRTKLKRELQTGINELLEGGYVSGVFFTEFIIQ
ncbi:MAG: flagellar basal body-associated FliL family protein [Planctomycetota bacterium]